MPFKSSLRLLATLAEDLPGAPPDGGRSLTFVGAPAVLDDRPSQLDQVAASAPQRARGHEDGLVAA